MLVIFEPFRQMFISVAMGSVEFEKIQKDKFEEQHTDDDDIMFV